MQHQMQNYFVLILVVVVVGPFLTWKVAKEYLNDLNRGTKIRV